MGRKKKKDGSNMFKKWIIIHWRWDGRWNRSQKLIQDRPLSGRLQLIRITLSFALQTLVICRNNVFFSCRFINLFWRLLELRLSFYSVWSSIKYCSPFIKGNHEIPFIFLSLSVFVRYILYSFEKFHHFSSI